MSNYGNGLYSSSSDAIISGNQICTNAGIGATIAGIETIFSSNTVDYNLNEGLYVTSDGFSSVISSNTFVENFNAAGYQMELSSANCTVTSNTFEGDSISGYGLEVISGYQASIVSDNIFTGHVGTFWSFQNAIYPVGSFATSTIFRNNEGLNLLSAPPTSLFWVDAVGYINALGKDAWYGAGNATSTWATGQTYTVTGFDVTIYLSGGGSSTTVVVNGQTIVNSAQLTALSIPAPVGTTITITDSSSMPNISITPTPQ